MPRVLVVDDDEDVREAVCDLLRRYGFAPRGAATRAEAVAGARDADLVLLDLGLPDGDGLEVCASLADVAPLIVISARVGEADRVSALELGADDYLPKPFGPRELVARCRSVLRRSTPRAVVRSGDIEIDLDRYEVRRRGESLRLTSKEREIAVCIARRRGGVVRRDELAREVWRAPLALVGRSVDVHVSSLRRKLGDDPRSPRHLQTVHGIGFRLVP